MPYLGHKFIPLQKEDKILSIKNNYGFWDYMNKLHHCNLTSLKAKGIYVTVMACVHLCVYGCMYVYVCMYVCLVMAGEQDNSQKGTMDGQ